MKNFGLLVLGLVIGAAVMYFYCGNQLNTMEEIPISKPNGLITPSEAKTLDLAYNIKHSVINDSLFKKSTDGGDNRSSWWKIEDIEHYIAYAKNQARENGFVMDGLRVYLGAYPDTSKETGLTTMFFIPTGYKNTSEGNMLSMPQSGGGDLTGSDGLNKGQHGDPPGTNYPQ